MSNYRVLVADDNPSMRKLIGMLLKQIGILDVDYACNGDDLVLKYKSSNYDMIILDNAMPLCSGIDFIIKYKDIININKTIIFIITAEPSSKFMKSVMNSGIIFKDVMAKPFDVQTMTTRIKNIISQYKLKSPQ